MKQAEEAQRPFPTTPRSQDKLKRSLLLGLEKQITRNLALKAANDHMNESSSAMLYKAVVRSIKPKHFVFRTAN